MSDFIDIGLVKTHLRVVHARDDKYIELLTKAALNSVLDFIDFKDWSAVNEKWGEVNPTTERLMLPCRNMGV